MAPTCTHLLDSNRFSRLINFSTTLSHFTKIPYSCLQWGCGHIMDSGGRGVCVCVCVCVWERVYVCVCVYLCVHVYVCVCVYLGVLQMCVWVCFDECLNV